MKSTELKPIIVARLFVRHSDGESLIVPGRYKELGRLSFGLNIDDSDFTTLKDAVREDDVYRLNDFEPQAYLGNRLRYLNTTGGLQRIEVHGYLAQIWPGRDATLDGYRAVIDKYDMHKIVRERDDFDYIDRQLAKSVLKGLRWP